MEEEEFQPVQPAPEHSKTKIALFVALALLVLGVAAALFTLTRNDSGSSDGSRQQVDTATNEPEIRAKLVAQGLEQPTGIVSTPDSSDNRLFILEQSGKIRIVADGTVRKQPFLDISSEVTAGGEMGLLGLAFHPNYPENGYFYVNFINESRETVVARYKVSGDADRADKSSKKVLLTTKQPFANHNGGDLAFGPDGYLYITLGDGGSAGDPQNNAQDKNTLLGKLLRIDVDEGDPYAVPDTNPFKNGAKPEIWAYGLRNPWRISFDHQTGELYIADVGQGDLEELNVQPVNSKGGENYGWRCMEGNSKFNTDSCPKASTFTSPALEYDHNEGRCSITGGYVYRGSKYPAMDGLYYYGDYCSGHIFSTSANTDWRQHVALETEYRISSFGQGSDGELYFADHDGGTIYALEDAAN